MCYTIQFVVDCAECSYRQRLGAPIRQICVVAAQGKPCRMHQNYESRDQHVCGSCLLAQEEREEKERKEAEEAERKRVEEEAAAAAKKKNDEIQVQNIMRQLARLRQ